MGTYSQLIFVFLIKVLLKKKESFNFYLCFIFLVFCSLFKQPIPVHTLPKVLDNILRPRYDDRCPKYDEMYDWYIKKSPEAKAMYNKYGHLFKEWSDQSGKRISHIEHVFSIYKKFLSQKQQNEPLVY